MKTPRSFPKLPRDHELPTGKQVFSTLCSFGCLIILVSLMSWCTLDYPKPTPAPQLTKEQMYQLTAKELAEQTARINAEMERRVKDNAR